LNHVFFTGFVPKKTRCRLEARKAPRPNDWTLARELTAAAEEPSGKVWKTTVEKMSKPIVPLFCSHQNSWVKMDVNNPLKMVFS